jgi:hypothetical protein
VLYVYVVRSCIMTIIEYFSKSIHSPSSKVNYYNKEKYMFKAWPAQQIKVIEHLYLPPNLTMIQCMGKENLIAQMRETGKRSWIQKTCSITTLSFIHLYTITQTILCCSSILVLCKPIEYKGLPRNVQTFY